MIFEAIGSCFDVSLATVILIMVFMTSGDMEAFHTKDIGREQTTDDKKTHRISQKYLKRKQIVPKDSCTNTFCRTEFNGD